MHPKGAGRMLRWLTDSRTQKCGGFAYKCYHIEQLQKSSKPFFSWEGFERHADYNNATCMCGNYEVWVDSFRRPATGSP